MSRSLRERLARSPEKFDSFGNGFWGDFGAGVGLPCLREKDEGALAAGEFFVASHFFDEGFGAEAVGEDERELKATQEGDDALAVFGSKGGVFLGKVESGADAEGDGFAVEEFAVG